MGFPRQEDWSGLPFPSARDLSDPGIEPVSPALAGRFFNTEPPGKPWFFIRSFSFYFIMINLYTFTPLHTLIRVHQP